VRRLSLLIGLAFVPSSSAVFGANKPGPAAGKTGEIGVIAGVTGSAASHQLRRLREQRIVDFDRDGTTINYRLTDQHIARFCREALFHADHVVTARRHGRPPRAARP